MFKSPLTPMELAVAKMIPVASELSRSDATGIILATASSIGVSGDLNITGVISGANALTKVGTARLSLSANNTYGTLGVISTILTAGSINLNGNTAGNITS